MWRSTARCAVANHTRRSGAEPHLPLHPHPQYSVRGTTTSVEGISHHHLTRRPDMRPRYRIPSAISTPERAKPLRPRSLPCFNKPHCHQARRTLDARITPYHPPTILPPSFAPHRHLQTMMTISAAGVEGLGGFIVQFLEVWIRHAVRSRYVQWLQFIWLRL